MSEERVIRVTTDSAGSQQGHRHVVELPESWVEGISKRVVLARGMPTVEAKNPVANRDVYNMAIEGDADARAGRFVSREEVYGIPAPDTEFVKAVRELAGKLDKYQEQLRDLDRWHGFWTQVAPLFAKVNSLLPEAAPATEVAYADDVTRQCVQCSTTKDVKFREGTGWLCEKHAKEKAGLREAAERGARLMRMLVGLYDDREEIPMVMGAYGDDKGVHIGVVGVEQIRNVLGGLEKALEAAK